VKDISDDDRPLQTSEVQHSITGGYANHESLTLGNRAPRHDSGFDGLIDEVRLSDAALSSGEMLLTKTGMNAHTAGYWQFEEKPGVFRDTSEHHLDIAEIPAKKKVDPRKNALADFCHVLLNSNEFLYVE
jgi:hypothetical protein